MRFLSVLLSQIPDPTPSNMWFLWSSFSLSHALCSLSLLFLSLNGKQSSGFELELIKICYFYSILLSNWQINSFHLHVFGVIATWSALWIGLLNSIDALFGNNYGHCGQRNWFLRCKWSTLVVSTYLVSCIRPKRSFVLVYKCGLGCSWR